MRWVYFSLAFLFAGASIILSTPASALVTVGAISEMDVVEAVEVEGNIAYVVGRREYHYPRSIYGLQVVDVSDPRMPRELSFYKTSGPREIAVEDGLAYLADGYGGLRIIDVADPTSPAEIGSLDTPGAAADVKIVDGLAYLADSYSGFRIIDVSDPTLPREIGVFETVGSAHDVEIVGSVAYVAITVAGAGWLQTIDISTPAAPAGLDRISAPDSCFDVEVVGPLAYITGNGFIRVIDVSDPAALKQIGGVALGRGEDIEILGERAYLAASTEGLLIFDVSNPATPVEIGRLDTPGYAVDIELAGNLTFVADWDSSVRPSSMRIIDASNAVVPAMLGEIFAGSSPLDVEVVDELAYVASSGWGPYLRIFDVSNPSQPFEIGATEDGGARAVTVNGTLAYVVSYRHLRIIDISTPSFPSEVALLEISRDLQDVEVAAGVAYVASYSAGLRIIDVSNPTDPIEIAALEIPGSARDVQIVGSIAYVAGGGGLLVIDVSNPSEPILIGSIRSNSRYPWGVAVSGNYAYVADGNFGLQIFDVSNPTRLTSLGHLPTPDGAWDVAVSGGVAYLALDHSGVRAVDVSLPEWPLELGALGFDIWKEFVGIEVYDGLVYAVTEVGSRLYIVEFGPEYVTEVAASVDIKPGSDPNPINFSIEGVIPVAILGSDEMDVAAVDETTLAFGRGGAAPAHCHRPHLEDVNGDGYLDLLSHFRTDETGIAFGERMACLSGETLDGLWLRGCDSVRTVPDMDGDGLLDLEEETLGTNALNSDTDGDGFEDGEEVLALGTDPLDPLDPTPIPVPEPASWLMLGVGACAVALLRRVSRRG